MFPDGYPLRSFCIYTIMITLNNKRMTKREIFEEIFNVVCDVCEVDKTDILSGVKRTEVVEARCIAAHFLIRYGVLLGDVVRFSNGLVRYRQCVNNSANLFDFRKKVSFSFCNDANCIGKILETRLK